MISGGGVIVKRIIMWQTDEQRARDAFIARKKYEKQQEEINNSKLSYFFNRAKLKEITQEIERLDKIIEEIYRKKKTEEMIKDIEKEWHGKI
jgi:transcription termination factor NusB